MARQKRYVPRYWEGFSGLLGNAGGFLGRRVMRGEMPSNWRDALGRVAGTYLGEDHANTIMQKLNQAQGYLGKDNRFNNALGGITDQVSGLIRGENNQGGDFISDLRNYAADKAKSIGEYFQTPTDPKGQTREQYQAEKAQAAEAKAAQALSSQAPAAPPGPVQQAPTLGRFDAPTIQRDPNTGAPLHNVDYSQNPLNVYARTRQIGPDGKPVTVMRAPEPKWDGQKWVQGPSQAVPLYQQGPAQLANGQYMPTNQGPSGTYSPLNARVTPGNSQVPLTRRQLDEIYQGDTLSGDIGPKMYPSGEELAKALNKHVFDQQGVTYQREPGYGWERTSYARPAERYGDVAQPAQPGAVPVAQQGPQGGNLDPTRRQIDANNSTPGVADFNSNAPGAVDPKTGQNIAPYTPAPSVQVQPPGTQNIPSNTVNAQGNQYPPAPLTPLQQRQQQLAQAMHKQSTLPGAQTYTRVGLYGQPAPSNSGLMTTTSSGGDRNSGTTAHGTLSFDPSTGQTTHTPPVTGQMTNPPAGAQAAPATQAAAPATQNTGSQTQNAAPQASNNNAPVYSNMNYGHVLAQGGEVPRYGWGGYLGGGLTGAGSLASLALGADQMFRKKNWKTAAALGGGGLVGSLLTEELLRRQFLANKKAAAKERSSAAVKNALKPGEVDPNAPQADPAAIVEGPTPTVPGSGLSFQIGRPWYGLPDIDDSGIEEVSDSVTDAAHGASVPRYGQGGYYLGTGLGLLGSGLGFGAMDQYTKRRMKTAAGLGAGSVASYLGAGGSVLWQLLKNRAEQTLPKESVENIFDKGYMSSDDPAIGLKNSSGSGDANPPAAPPAPPMKYVYAAPGGSHNWYSEDSLTGISNMLRGNIANGRGAINNAFKPTYDPQVWEAINSEGFHPSKYPELFHPAPTTDDYLKVLEEHFNGPKTSTTNAYGGTVPRYNFGGYAPSYAMGGPMGNVISQGLSLSEAQSLQAENAQGGQGNYFTRAMMDNSFGGQAAGGEQQQQPGAQGQGVMLPSGVYDPTGELAATGAYANMQQGQPGQQPQQPITNPEIKSRVPYYQQMYNKLASKAAMPKGATKKILGPKRTRV